MITLITTAWRGNHTTFFQKDTLSVASNVGTQKFKMSPMTKKRKYLSYQYEFTTYIFATSKATMICLMISLLASLPFSSTYAYLPQLIPPLDGVRSSNSASCFLSSCQSDMHRLLSALSAISFWVTWAQFLPYISMHMWAILDTP